MKKFLMILVGLYVLAFSVSLFMLVKPFNNEFIECDSAFEYKLELNNAIESLDYKNMSNIIYSIKNSEYYEEMYNDAAKGSYKKWPVTKIDEHNVLANQLILLLGYIDVNEDSVIEIKNFSLEDKTITYFDFELDGVAGYYTNYLVLRTSVKDTYNDFFQYDSKADCINDKSLFSPYCQSQLFIEPAYNIYDVEEKEFEFEGYIDFTLFVEDYNDKDAEPIVDYKSSKEFDKLVDRVYTLNDIVNGDFNDKKLALVQDNLIEEINRYNVNDDVYGDFNSDGVIDEDDYDENGVNKSIIFTYELANENNALVNFVSKDYYIKGEPVDYNEFINNYDEYEDMFHFINYYLPNS